MSLLRQPARDVRARDCWRQQFAAALIVLIAGPASAADPYSSKTYPRDAAKELVVETDSGPIVVRPAIDGPIAVDVTPAAPGDDCRVTQDLRGKTLHLSIHAARNALGLSKTCAAGFTVGGTFEEISARSGSGDIVFDSEARKVDARTGSGAVTVGAVSRSAELTLRSGSGPVTGTASAAKVDAQTGSGDIRLTGLTGLVKARSGAGAVSLDWDAAPASGAIEVNTGSGGLEASFPKGTRLKTSLRSATGRIRSDLDDKDARLTLTFRSGSGGATVTRKP